jgi:hypothetical protein
VDPKQNPGLRLGAALAEAAKVGRDKLTILASHDLVSFGGWAEQLIAESTGKEGKGLVPIDQEPLGEKSVYGDDRIFASLALGTERPAETPGPAVTLHLGEKLDLGAEFFRWEYATAVAGALLGIDPFDEPNVQESKDNTSRILSQLGKAPPPPMPTLSEGGIDCWTDGTLTAKDLPTLLAAFVAQAPKNGYVALQAYLPPSDGRAWPRPWATGRDSSTPPASSTRAVPRWGPSCSSPGIRGATSRSLVLPMALPN